MFELVKSSYCHERQAFCVFVLLLGFVLPANAASPELKPVLKAIDPASAKLDIVPKEEPKPAPQINNQKPEPNFKYTPYKSSNTQEIRVPPANNQAPPRSGSYGMGAPAAKPYTPSTNPNNRYNQVFTPPWAKNNSQQTQRVPSNSNYVNQRPQGYQSPQGNYLHPNQGYRAPAGGYQPRQQYRAPAPVYQNAPPQYYRPPNQGYYPPQNQYQQPYNNRQTYRPPNQNPYGYQNRQVPNQNYQYRRDINPNRQGAQQRRQDIAPNYNRSYPNQNNNNGFPSANLIPQFGKPLPMNASNKGMGGRWTSNTQPRQFQGNNLNPESRVAKLEQTAFGATYPEHDVEARLDHLEKEIFGSKSSGSVESRLSKLEYKLGGKGAFNSGFTGSSVDKKKQVSVASKKKDSPVNKSDIGTTVSATNSSNLQEIVDRIPYNKRAGDYFDKVRKFPGNTVARWNKFPVRVRIPDKTPPVWIDSVDKAIEVWNSHIPIRKVDRAESSQIELSWINHLPPKILAVSRLTAHNGQIKVKIFLLRPTYYVPSLNERALKGVLVHELGHALGIFGHSASNKDTMFLMQLASESDKLTNTNIKKIGARDLNTLRRIYESPSLPAKFSTTKPMEWSYKLQ